MADDAQVLKFLREQFRRVHDEFAEIRTWRADVFQRLASLERQIVAVRRDSPEDAMDMVHVRERTDTF